MGLLDYFIIVQCSFLLEHPWVLNKVFQEVIKVLIYKILKSIFLFIYVLLFELQVIQFINYYKNLQQISHIVLQVLVEVVFQPQEQPIVFSNIIIIIWIMLLYLQQLFNNRGGSIYLSLFNSMEFSFIYRVIYNFSL